MVNATLNRLRKKVEIWLWQPVRLGFLSLFPDAPVWHLGIYREKVSLKRIAFKVITVTEFESLGVSFL